MPQLSAAPSLRRALYENDGALLFQIVSYVPLLFGAWIAGGLQMRMPIVFGLILGSVIALHYLSLSLRGQIPLWSERKVTLVLSSVLSLLVLLFAALTQAPAASFLLASYVGLGVAQLFLPQDTIRSVLIHGATVIARTSIIAVLGAFSQFPFLVPAVAVIGYVPGCFLAASFVAAKSELFERGGWERTKIVRDKKSQEDKLRPARLTQLFVLLFISGPLIPIAFAPFGPLPSPFLLGASPLYFMPALANGFFERLQDDRVTALRTLNVAAFAALVMLAAGLLANA
ncbi:MAG: hypothetical protein U0136_16870 [Bdellovibrionota bacterium]